MSKYDRLLYILNLLRSRNKLRASDLAKECEVSERTIYRDIIDLSSANIPIYFDDGYKLLTDAFLPPLNFDLDDYLTLKLALESSPLSQQSPLKRSAKRVLTKIDTNLSSGLKAKLSEISAEGEKEPVKIDVKSTSDFSKFSLWFNLIEQAILHNMTIKLSYESLDSGETIREVDPYGLVFRRHAWYFIGFCHLRQKIRIFRINRIKKISLLNKTFERGKDFSVTEFFKDSWEIYQGEPTEVEIKFKGKAVKVIESGIHHPSEKIEKLDDGSLIYKVKVRGTEEILRWILGFKDEAEVLRPEKLREEIKQISEKLSCVYT
jgi:predicted DNA-binding transcriptional regulator YafY